MAELLKLQYGTGSLPSLTAQTSTALNGTMYVLTGSDHDANNVYSGSLFFDLGGKRYQINSSVAARVANSLTLQLAGQGMSSIVSGAANSYNGSEGVIWNIPLASTSTLGLVSTAAQTFGGAKTFADAATFSNTVTIAGAITANGDISAHHMNPAADETYTLGTDALRWNHVYAVNLHGNLDGNATTAATADKVKFSLRTFNLSNTQTKSYNGEQAVDIRLSDLVGTGETIPVSMIPPAALERIVTYQDLTAATTAKDAGDIQPGDLVEVLDTGVMYYVHGDATAAASTWTLESFIAGKASEASVADAVKYKVRLLFGNNTTPTSEYNGSAQVDFRIPFASADVAGLVSLGEQTFAGAKTFSGATLFKANAEVEGTLTTRNILPAVTTSYNLGSTDAKWNEVYATTFKGSLDGNAATATKVSQKLKFTSDASGFGAAQYDGSGEVTIGTFVPATNTAGSAGFVPGPSANKNMFLRSDGTWSTIANDSNSYVTFTWADPKNNQSNSSLTVSHITYFQADGTNLRDGKTLTSGATFSVPTFSYDKAGHIKSTSFATMTMGTVSPAADYAEGDLIANVLGVDIHSGIAWGTFGTT